MGLGSFLTNDEGKVLTNICEFLWSKDFAEQANIFEMINVWHEYTEEFIDILLTRNIFMSFAFKENSKFFQTWNTSLCFHAKISRTIFLEITEPNPDHIFRLYIGMVIQIRASLNIAFQRISLLRPVLCIHLAYFGGHPARCLPFFSHVIRTQICNRHWAQFHKRGAG